MSMSLTPTQLQALIVAEVSDPDGVLQPQIATIWTLNALSGRTPYLKYLYAKRSAVSLLQGAVRTRITRQEDDIKFDAGEYFKNLASMYADVCAEIIRVEKIARASGGTAVGVLTATSSDPNPSGDPNSVSAESPVIRGDAYGDQTQANGLPR